MAAPLPNQWNARKQRIFLEHYRATGNVTFSAKAAGVAAKTVWDRRGRSAAFRAAFDEAKEEAYVRLEYMLIEEGGERLALEPAEGDWRQEGRQPPAPDPQLAMWLLKRRDSEAQGRGPRRGGVRPRVAANAEVKAAFTKALEAFGGRLEAEDRAAEEEKAQGTDRPQA